MRLINLTTIVLTATFGSIMGIFISSTTGDQTMVIEGILLGASVGIMVGSIASFSNILFVRDYFRRIVMDMFPIKKTDSDVRRIVQGNRKKAVISI